MLRFAICLSFGILFALPCAATADGYLPLPVPKTLPQRPTLRQVFHWLDTDRDGYLTLDEFLAAPWIRNKQQGARFFYWMDTNKDGLVSLPEFLAAYKRYCRVYAVRVAYPWGWTLWRPWSYGWYWQAGWHRRPGAWRGYAGPRPSYVLRPYRPAKSAGPAGHPRPAKHVKHVRPRQAKHGGGHKGHGHRNR